MEAIDFSFYTHQKPWTIVDLLLWCYQRLSGVGQNSVYLLHFSNKCLAVSWNIVTFSAFHGERTELIPAYLYSKASWVPWLAKYITLYF